MTLENGTLAITRLADGRVRLDLIGARSLSLTWGPLGTVAALSLLRDQADNMPVDTSEHPENRTVLPGATVTIRCAPASCWAVITHTGKSGYWRPRPDFTPLLLRELANAIDAARLGIGALWIKDLR